MVRAGGGIVFRTVQGTWEAVQVDGRKLEYESAFDIELLMLVVAKIVVTGNDVPIHTDCASAMKVYKGAGRRYTPGAATLLRMAARKLGGDNFVKVKAHPERKGFRWNEWGEQERGIYLADLVAGGDHARYEQITGNRVTIISDDEVVRHIHARVGLAIKSLGACNAGMNVHPRHWHYIGRSSMRCREEGDGLVSSTK